MAQSHSAMLTHLIFSTKNRAPVLEAEIRSELFRYFSGVKSGLSGLAAVRCVTLRAHLTQPHAVATHLAMAGLFSTIGYFVALPLDKYSTHI